MKIKLNEEQTNLISYLASEIYWNHSPAVYEIRRIAWKCFASLGVIIPSVGLGVTAEIEEIDTKSALNKEGKPFIQGRRKKVLSECQIMEIKKEYDSGKGKSKRSLARDYKVSEKTIRNILKDA